MKNISMWLAALIAIAASARGDSNSVEQEEVQPKLRKINTLSDNCVETLCQGFHYDNVDEVAFFDLKTEVHINDGESSYDIVNPRHHDVLIFENSTFAQFPLNLFYAVNVKELDVRNCSIQLVTWECFLMAANLQILLLSHNQLDHIAGMTFNYAETLQYLFLDSNRLQTLVSESFKGLNNVRYLDLGHNRLQELPAGVFDYLPQLQELHMDDNRLHTIENALLLSNHNLNIITISRNQLAEIGEYAMKEQSQLVLLDISSNPALRTLVMTVQSQNLIAANCSLSRINIYGPVQHVDLSDNQILELYFAQPEALRTLNLRNNSLQQISSLKRATQLLALDLGDNPAMGALPAPWMANALERLNLGNTGLKQLPIAALAEQPKLRFLNVSGNQLRDINPLNFRHLKQLTHFDIHANDWNCYNLRLLMDLLMQPNRVSYGHDRFDAEFPGEYINGIACMYRMEAESDVQSGESDEVNAVQEQLAQSHSSNENAYAQAAQLKSDPNVELESLRRELKAIVLFYKQKFDKAFDMIDDLNARLAEFERMNATYWQDVTITV